MSSRIMPMLRVIAGAIVGATIGAIAGAIIVMVIATAVAKAIGNEGGGVLGMIMLLYGVPIAVVVGAVLGGWAVAAGRSSAIFRFAAITVLALTGFAIVLALVLPDNTPKPVVDAKGCTISPRDGTLAKDERYVVVYDRYCRGGEGHTVNVSVVPSALDSIVGPGNVLVLAGEPTANGAARNVEAYADIRDSTHLVVEFDHRAHVLGQSSPVLGFEVTLRPDLELPLQTPPRPDPLAAFRAREESLAVRAATTIKPSELAARADRKRYAVQRETAAIRMQMPKLEPWVFTDTKGCTISKRLHVRPYVLMYVVYERLCLTEPRRTMNVSQVAPTASVDGPGNVLVLVNDEPIRGDSTRLYNPVSVRMRDPRHIDIAYAARYRVVSSDTALQGVAFTFRADSNFQPMGASTPIVAP